MRKGGWEGRGRKEGRKEGRNDGWEDGRMEGRKEGCEENKKTGPVNVNIEAAVSRYQHSLITVVVGQSVVSSQ